MQRRVNRHRGFSLVEMLVAVAIIGLLVGLVGPAAMRQLNSSRVKTTQAQISQLRAAIEIFEIDVGRPPTTSEGLNALVSNPGQLAGWNGPYLRDGKLPKDAWGGEFELIDDQGAMRIRSFGADGRPGGDGENADIKS